jgi:hypothetical protein
MNGSWNRQAAAANNGTVLPSASPVSNSRKQARETAQCEERQYKRTNGTYFKYFHCVRTRLQRFEHLVVEIRGGTFGLQVLQPLDEQRLVFQQYQRADSVTSKSVS